MSWLRHATAKAFDQSGPDCRHVHHSAGGGTKFDVAPIQPGLFQNRIYLAKPSVDDVLAAPTGAAAPSAPAKSPIAPAEPGAPLPALSFLGGFRTTAPVLVASSEMGHHPKPVTGAVIPSQFRRGCAAGFGV